MFIQIYISNIFLLDDLFNPFHINCNHCANTSYIHHSLNESLVPTVCVARLIDQPNRINLICGWCRWNPSLRVMRIVNIYTWEVGRVTKEDRILCRVTSRDKFSIVFYLFEKLSKNEIRWSIVPKLVSQDLNGESWSWFA